MPRTARLIARAAWTSVLAFSVSLSAADDRDAAPPDRAAPAGGVRRGWMTTAAGGPSQPIPFSLIRSTGAPLVMPEPGGPFRFGALALGRYVLRTHRAAGAGVRRVVEVTAGPRLYESVELAAAAALASEVRLAGSGVVDVRRWSAVGAGVGRTASRGRRPAATQVAGVGRRDEAGDDPDALDEMDAVDPVVAHDDRARAWRLRHARRSVLKDAGFGLPEMDGHHADFEGPNGGAGASGRMAVAGEPGDAWLGGLFGTPPVAAEVQLLTRATLSGAGALRAADPFPGQVASVALASREGTEWAIRGAFDMAAGRTSSWMVAGWYTADPHDDHSVQLSLSYSKQASAGAVGMLPPEMTPAATEAVTRTREVGSLDALDSWAVAPRVTVDYGATLARYGYLDDGTLFSPRAAVALTPFERTRVRVAASRIMTAPGAEQFLPPLEGTWLPPKRTFTSQSRIDELQAERTAHIEVGVEQRVGGTVVGVRRFSQDVDDQLITMFETGRQVPPATLLAPGGHYVLASASGMAAAGWGVHVRHDANGLVSASVDYSFVRTQWRPGASALSPGTTEMFRAAFDRFHDLTTSVEAEIPGTSTRVSARCRVSSAFARADRQAVAAGLDARFDVRLMQELPFSPIDGSRWQVLVAVRSLFYEPMVGGSVYDELLVVDPPSQFVGGLVVHF